MLAIKNIAGNILHVTVPEKLAAKDFQQLSPCADALIREQGNIRLLVDASGFQGWENTDALEKHISFVKSHHHHIERVALLAGQEWQRWMAQALSMFVHPEVRVFDKNAIKQAKEWISG